MTFEIQTLNADGSGYMLVTADDGSTFGQLFHGLPVDNAAACREALSTMCEKAVARQVPAPAMHGQVTAMLHAPIVVDPNRGRP